MPRQPRHVYRARRRWRWAAVGLVLALALPTFAIARRTHQYGPGYWLIYGPGYWVFGTIHTGTEHHGPFTVDHYRDRRTGTTTHVVMPGDDELLGWGSREDPRRYAWHVFAGGRDLTGDKRPNLIFRRYAGAGANFYAIFEWDGGQARLLHQTDETILMPVDLDDDGVYEWVYGLHDPPPRLPLLDFDRLHMGPP